MTTSRRRFEIHSVTVSRVHLLTPHMTRITVVAPTLADYTDSGPDQRFKLFLPKPGQAELPLPDPSTLMTSLREMPESERPIVRTYTIRAIRSETCEIDIDFVMHGDNGPASAWAARARPGDICAISNSATEYQPPPDTDWLLLAGDITALPAMAAILERRPADQPAHVWINVPSAQDEQTLATHEKVHVRWLHGDERAANDDALLDAVRNFDFPPGSPYAWVAAESAVATSLRRHLIDRDLPRDRIKTAGYWKAGVSIEDDR